VTIAVADERGRLNHAPAAPAANPPAVVDGLMAATAKVHRLTLVTRVVNVERMGAAVLNPFEPA
jgi:hypothetical protein